MKGRGSRRPTVKTNPINVRVYGTKFPRVHPGIEDKHPQE